MGLSEVIVEQIKVAMKNGDKVRLETLRSLRAAILEFETAAVQKEFTAEEEVKLLLSASKKRKDAIEMYVNANRSDLAEKEQLELAIIQEFLPKQLDRSEISAIISQIIVDVNAEGIKDKGKVMGPAMKQLRGKADGTLVQEIVAELLESF
ncbi:MAG: GatB/YqeY domain-containing protein [Candidatus Kapabacteria bacterium]|nr:GatB/YqeY domain-containing protein [Candidatus Kapabacteria bacterium]